MGPTGEADASDDGLYSTSDGPDYVQVSAHVVLSPNDPATAQTKAGFSKYVASHHIDLSYGTNQHAQNAVEAEAWVEYCSSQGSVCSPALIRWANVTANRYQTFQGCNSDACHAGLVLAFAGATRFGARAAAAAEAEDLAAEEVFVEEDAAAVEASAAATRGPVGFRAPPGATADEIAQVKAYCAACNAARKQGALSPTGRVSTTGFLHAASTRAAAEERAAAKAAGSPYAGQVGHVPDTTWTGNPQPHSWMDLSPRVNASLGGQAGAYPLGYMPTEFYFIE